MATAVKQRLRKRLWYWTIFKRLILRETSCLHDSGWIESFKRGYPCSRDGSELPWMNYPVINLLQDRLRQEFTLFEYGSGYSTLFYARLVHSVRSVEYNKEWFDRICAKVPGHVSIIYREEDVDGQYCRSIHELDQAYDVVIVDGMDRVNCIKQAMQRLSQRGVIVLDDSDREIYREAFEHLRDNGFRQLSLRGLKPTGFEHHQTTIFYREGNGLDI